MATLPPLFSLLLLIFAPFTFAQTDRECGTDMTNLWLDIVLVVDNSAPMTTEGITQLAATTTRTFGNARFGAQQTDPRNTRFAIVTYDTKATVVADLDKIQSTDEFYQTVFGTLSSVTASQKAYLSTGLEAAEKVFADGRQNGERSRYQKLVLVYAASYSNEAQYDPLPIAQRLKGNNTNIATVAIAWDGDVSLYGKLSQIASPGFNYTINDLDVIVKLQESATQTNCFCNSYNFQYKSSFSDENSHKYGVCILVSLLQDPWVTAKISCQNAVMNGYLVTVFDQQKHDFLLAVAQNRTPFYSPPFSYHIGLNFVNGGWNWQQPSGFPVIPLGSYAPWNPSFPHSNQLTGVAENQNGAELKVGWENVNAYQDKRLYMCEVAACDTDNYYC